MDAFLATENRIVGLVGLQKFALALAILFTFFPKASEMILIAAFWGIWHLISGLLLAYWWSRSPAEEEACHDAS